MTNDYASTAYWYACPGAEDFFVMRPVQERETIPVDRWKDLRDELTKPFLRGLRRQLAETAGEISAKSSDPSLVRSREGLIWRVLTLADEVDLPNIDRARVQRRLLSLASRPEQEQLAGVNAILLELARKLRAIE